MSELKDQHIIGLTAENVKRLTVVKIDLEANTGNVIVSGPNGAGKSSVLDAITMALCGEKSHPEKPVRDGKDRATIILKTEDLTVTRKFIGDSTYLEVRTNDNRQVSSPQKLLDTLISKVAIDPLAFASLDSKEQGKMLLQLFPPKIDLKKNAEDYKRIEMERRDVNRDIETLKGQIKSYADVPEDAPTKEVSILALSEDLQKLQSEQSKQGNTKGTLELHKRAIASNLIQINKLKELTAELEEKVAKEEAYLKEAKDVTADIANLREQMNKADQQNHIVRRASDKKDLQKRGKAAVDKSNAFTVQLEDLKLQRAEALLGAKFPVEGLAIDTEGSLVFNKVPLAQCSSAEQIRVGLALASAANPGLKVAFVKHGSLLDGKSLQHVSDIAKQYGMQVWIERVDDSSPTAIHIVDGTNVGAADSDGTAGDDKPKPTTGKGMKSDALFG